MSPGPPANDGVGTAGSTRPFVIALGAVTAAALAIRIAFIVVVAPKVPALGDASAYHLLAEQLARGEGYIRPFDYLLLHLRRPTAEYPPLFPFVLSLAARAGAHSVEQQRICTAFIGAGTVGLIGLLGRRIASPVVGLMAAALAAIYPMLFLGEATLMAESLYVALVTVVLLAAYRAFDDPKPGRFAVLGAAIGLATLTRAEGALLGVVVVVPLGFLLGRKPGDGREPLLGARARTGRVAIALGVALAVVAPWTIRNEIRFHRFVPVSNNISTLVDGANCDATYHGPQIGLWRETFSQPDGGEASAATLPQAQACFEGFDIANPNFDEAAAASMHTRAGLSYARQHLGALPKVSVVRVFRTWGLYAPRQQVDFESLEGRPRSWQMRGTIMYWILLPGAIVGAFLLRRRRRLLWPLLATAVTVTIVAAATYGQQRFRIAAEPAILVLAAVAADAAAGALRARARNGSPEPGDPPGSEQVVG